MSGSGARPEEHRREERGRERARARRRSLACAACLALLGAGGGTLLAAEPEAAAAEPALELTAEVASRYLWRGWDVMHADPALLLTATVAPPAAPGFWTSAAAIAGLRTDAAVGDGRNVVDEVDLTVGWERGGLAGGRVTAGLSLAAYVYVSTWTRAVAYQDDLDVEANLYVRWDAAEHLRPSLDYDRGLDDGIRGDYLEAAVAFPFERAAWSTEPCVIAGWSRQFDAPGRVSHVSVVLPVTWRRGPLAVTPSVAWTWVRDPEGYNPEELVGTRPRSSLFVASLRVAWSR